MKLQKLVFLFLCLTIFSSTLSAQSYAFKVMVNKGKTEIKSGTSWLPVKVGLTLAPSDEIRLAENSYVGLVHTTGKPMELKASGKYSVRDLAAKVSQGSSVLNKYTDFILSSAASPKTNLNATGAVHRGDEIPLNLPTGEKGVIFNSEVIITWDSDKLTPPYKVSFNSLFDDELYTVETKNNYVTVNLSDRNFNNEDNILVSVTSLSNNLKTENYSLSKLSKNDHERIKTLIKENNIDVNESSAVGKLFLARFYEENGLLIDAGTALKKAVIAEPDVPAYQEAYIDFLYRTGIKETAQK